METFLWDPAEKGAAQRPAQAIAPNELLSTFSSLRILQYEETAANPDWGNESERKPTRLVRLVAQKYSR
jgi:hypothetical protein